MKLEEQSRQLAENMKKWIEEKNGTDIKVLDIHGVSSLGDYFVIASGSRTVRSAPSPIIFRIRRAKWGSNPKMWKV